MMNKQYRSNNFVSKIEINLANISSKPTDEFKLVKAYYDIHSFDCELCGHKNCMYAFEVQNLQTNNIIKVGSDCIHHFEGRGVDIDVAEGLMKRVLSASNKARRDLKMRLGNNAWFKIPVEERKQIKSYNVREYIEKLGNEEYKKLSKQEKRELIVNEFILLQTKELLSDVSRNKTILAEEDIERIAELGLEKEMERALEMQKRYTV